MLTHRGGGILSGDTGYGCIVWGHIGCGHSGVEVYCLGTLGMGVLSGDTLGRGVLSGDTLDADTQG